MRTLIIAEAGVNHNGDIDIAKNLISEAAIAGADFVKFQTFTALNIASKTTQKANYQKKFTNPNEGQFDMLSKLELSKNDHEILIEECNRHKIGFLSTAFDIQSFDMLVGLNCLELVKIPSGELTNLPYLRHVGNSGKPVILSTGMADLGEIEDAIHVIESAGTPRHLITVLQCTTEYPTPMHDVNLRAMNSIRHAFGVQVGLSDHTSGIEVSIAAVALGASVIEKHFTLDQTMPGPDHSASLEPAELRAMITGIRNIEIALGSAIKKPCLSEIKNKSVVRRSIVASRFIRVGDVFTVENISVKRPGSGISPMHWDHILGRAAIRDFSPDEMIEI